MSIYVEYIERDPCCFSDSSFRRNATLSRRRNGTFSFVCARQDRLGSSSDVDARSSASISPCRLAQRSPALYIFSGKLFNRDAKDHGACQLQVTISLPQFASSSTRDLFRKLKNCGRFYPSPYQKRILRSVDSPIARYTSRYLRKRYTNHPTTLASTSTSLQWHKSKYYLSRHQSPLEPPQGTNKFHGNEFDACFLNVPQLPVESNTLRVRPGSTVARSPGVSKVGAATRSRLRLIEVAGVSRRERAENVQRRGSFSDLGSRTLCGCVHIARWRASRSP